MITFDCGPDPVTITLDRTAKIYNNTGPDIVIDGGGKVTLSGGGRTRILYMNTCDPDLVWTTAMCQDQDHPRLVLQNITFANGDSSDDTTNEGGGAIWARGGQIRLVNTRFFHNTCTESGIELGGGAVRARSQYQGRPVLIATSTFGGAEGYGNACANGGALSTIGASWTIYNTLFSYNAAVGTGGRVSGTPGGGAGGAIYNDGNTMTLSMCGTAIDHNSANEFGSAILFVSNDLTGDIRIERSVITQNTGGSWYTQYPMISAHDETPIVVVDSTIE